MAATAPKKACSGCGAEKSLENFYRLRTGKFGVRSKCKSCVDKQARNYEAGHVEDRRRWSRRRYAADYEKGRAKCRAAYVRHREDRLAKTKTPKGKFKNYKAEAKSRGIAWELSFEDFLAFWQKPCFYCGEAIPTIGLDRLDNSMGYLLDNVVACCTKCNSGKLNGSAAEFVARCKRVAARFVGTELNVLAQKEG